MVPRTPRPRIRRREFSLLYLLWALLLCALPVSLNLLITNWPKNLRQGRNKGDGTDGASSLELRRSHDQIQMTERDAILSAADTVLTAGNVVHVGVIQTRLSEDTRDVQTSDNVVVLSQASMIVDRLAGLASSTTSTDTSTVAATKDSLSQMKNQPPGLIDTYATAGIDGRVMKRVDRDGFNSSDGQGISR